MNFLCFLVAITISIIHTILDTSFEPLPLSLFDLSLALALRQI